MVAIITGKHIADFIPHERRRPYADEGDIRTFDVNAPIEQYVWHRDLSDRTINILEGEGWQFQFEGSLPYNLNEITEIDIPKDTFHRLIPGYNNLKIRIC